MPRVKDPLVFFRSAEILGGGWSPEAWWGWCRLMALARQRRACTPRTWPAAVLAIGPRDLCWLMERPRIDYALPILREIQQRQDIVLATSRGLVLDASSELARSQLGASFTLTLCKYAVLQGFSFPTRAPTSTPIHQPPPTPPSPAGSPRRVRRASILSLDQKGQETLDSWSSEADG